VLVLFRIATNRSGSCTTTPSYAERRPDGIASPKPEPPTPRHRGRCIVRGRYVLHKQCVREPRPSGFIAVHCIAANDQSAARVRIRNGMHAWRRSREISPFPVRHASGLDCTFLSSAPGSHHAPSHPSSRPGSFNDVLASRDIS